MSIGNPYAAPGSPPPAPPSRSFNFGLHLERGFNAFSQQWQQWVVIALVSILIMIAAFLLCILPIFIVIGPLMVGMYHAAFLALDGRPVSPETLNRGKENMGNSILAYFGILGLQLGPQLIFNLLQFALEFLAREGGAMRVLATLMMLGGMLAVYAAQFFFTAKTLFVFPLLADKQCSVGDAFRWSWRATDGRFWWIVLFSFLTGLLGGLGALLCLVGLLATIPMTYCMIASAYRECFPRAVDPHVASSGV